MQEVFAKRISKVVYSISSNDISDNLLLYNYYTFILSQLIVFLRCYKCVYRCTFILYIYLPHLVRQFSAAILVDWLIFYVNKKTNDLDMFLIDFFMFFFRFSMVLFYIVYTQTQGMCTVKYINVVIVVEAT